ncbi:twin-arginine translocase subunit TatC [Flavisolibacter ginsenosidimutans]|uniref:Sec-independent protein translocase protein TatC n=1 Tax=Flavisolibacter ginsenosidimutans TaxID=661481 RepID=A0A5B8ULN8_9BACT|nr:twin-arginine translocase subunit TatC [Flavisolibacter ginsenosidimutans]QEC56970.1 twin-arginine translocase subunit TatC [Flavisolibacter ginsenosidimutans]
MALSFFKRGGGNDERAEMSFIDHLEVLRGHLFRSVLAITIGAILIVVYRDFVVKRILLGPTHSDFPTYGVLCRIGRYLNLEKALCMKGLSIQMQSTGVANQFSTFISVMLIGGIILAFPYIFWEFWRFIRPALTKKELKNTRGVIFWVSVLFFIGVAFGYFVIAPYTLNFFGNFQLDENIENRWTIASYFDTLIPLVLGSGLAFQLPLLMILLAKIGIVSASYLRRMWKYAVVIIMIVAGVITPGPDVISQMTVAIPLLLLYGVSILLTRRIDKQKAEEEKEWS